MEAVLEDALDDDFSGLDKSEIETWHINLGGMLGRAEAALSLWEAYAAGGERATPPIARWITMLTGGGQYGFDLRCSPVLAEDILQENLWKHAAGAVMVASRSQLQAGCQPLRLCQCGIFSPSAGLRTG